MKRSEEDKGEKLIAGNIEGVEERLIDIL